MQNTLREGTECAVLGKFVPLQSMSKIAEYILNPDTLMAELRKEPRHRGWKILGVVVSGIILFLFYMWVYVAVLGLDLPKTAILRHRNAGWRTRVDQMQQQLDKYDDMLSLLELRDERIYRSVYGMDGIPDAVRFAGIGGKLRYEPLEGTSLLGLAKRLDTLEKRAYIQSVSFDDVTRLQRTAGDMAAHIPAIPPMNTDPSTYRLSSPFGYRSDPILGIGKRHSGMDFACPPGNPIYATGDGVVVETAYEGGGYGIHVEVDHGFGYRTRYAHMSRIDVVEGQQVSRGDCLGLSGRSGRITGPHLHYEVMYRKDFVNPALYMDLDMDPKDYFEMVRKPVDVK